METIPITKNASRYTCAFDTLLSEMRDVFYRLVGAGFSPTHIVSAHAPLCAYEEQSLQHDPPVSTFKGLPLLLSVEIPGDEMRFMRGSEVLARLHSIS